mmetsp:Transcript_13947/g.32730  ORF Transcript_13947/g.32730 Transcript_13947/m.32730 type:complete len:400 (+) Transcript_13947:51-1250(+)
MAVPALNYEELMSLTIHTEPSVIENFLSEWMADTSSKLHVESVPNIEELERQSMEEPDSPILPRLEEGEEVLPDATVLVEGPQGEWQGVGVADAGCGEEPVLSLVSLNPATASNFDLVRGPLHLLPELPGSSTSVRTVRVSCGRSAVNSMVIADTRVSQVHFTLRVRAARGGQVALELVDQSSNGTWVNGRKVGRSGSTPLALGDQILVLPACLVGRCSEVGFLLLHDARGARCTGVNVESGPPSPKDISVPRALEDNLSCGICTESLFRCLTVVPCGHNFCTTCLVKWRRRSYACPECREPVQQAVRSPSIDRVVETFLLAHPEAARTASEIKALEAAEREPNNAAMLRWLTRPRGSLPQEEAREVATPSRQRYSFQQPQGQREAQRGSTASAACVVS